jgi:predicted nucleic acid-binding protein
VSTPIVLVDTSVWIQFFRGSSEVGAAMDRLLDRGVVFVHPWSGYELGLGGTSAVQQLLLDRLPRPHCPADDEVRAFVLRSGLHGGGLGWVDATILAAAYASGMALWTADTALAKAVRKVRLPALRLRR